MERKIACYRVVCAGDMSVFEDIADRLIDGGFEPIGNFSCTSCYNPDMEQMDYTFSQAMVKYKD